MPVVRSAGTVSVSGEATAPVLPDSIQELESVEVEIDPSSRLSKGVLANNVHITGPPVYVGGPICSISSVRLDLCSADEAELRGGIVAGTKVVFSRTDEASRAIVVGDVAAKTVSLDGAIVYGNVIGREVRLRRCVVLGGVASAGSLSLDSCVVGTFHARDCTLLGDTYLLAFSASVFGRVEFDGTLSSIARTPFGSETQVGDVVLDQVHPQDFVQAEADSEARILGLAGRVGDLTSEEHLSDTLRLLASMAHACFPEKVRGYDRLPGAGAGEHVRSILWSLASG